MPVRLSVSLATPPNVRALSCEYGGTLFRGVSTSVSEPSASCSELAYSSGHEPWRSRTLCVRRWCLVNVVFRQKLKQGKKSARSLQWAAIAKLTSFRSRLPGTGRGAFQCESACDEPSSMTAQTVSAMLLWGRCSNRLTSEKHFPQPMYSHLCGFSPVCTRWWTVSALRWIKALPQLRYTHLYGRSLVCIL